MRRLGKALAALALQAGAAQAALIPFDSEFGPGTIIRDSRSGLDWLRLTVADGLSLNETLRATAPGGALAGFGIASLDQVHCTLIGPNLGLSDCQQPTFSRVDYEAAVSFRTLFGASSARYEVLAPRLPDEPLQAWALGVFVYSDLTADVDSQIANLAPDRPTRFFLVRQAAQGVPEPAGMALVGIGALVLWGCRRRSGLALSLE